MRAAAWLTSHCIRTRVCGVAVMATLLAGCVMPAPSDSSYADKAQRSLQTAASQTATVQVVLSQSLAGQMLQRFADQTVSETEDSLSSVSDQFASTQPPPSAGADAVRDRTTTLLSQASDAVATARIALRRKDRPQMAASEKQLAAVTDKLTDAQGKVDS